MEYIAVLVVAAAVFGICYLVDKGFTRMFRSQAQHMSGLSVRLNKRYATIGIIVAVLGIGAIVAGVSPLNWLLIAVGIVLALVGAALVTYYMTFGIFYDEKGFLVTTFGKRSKAYRYADIVGQLLYGSYGTVLIELHLKDGRTFQLQSTMVDVYPFLDKAFARWLEQTGRKQEDCSFYDPDNSCWFPNMEES